MRENDNSVVFGNLAFSCNYSNDFSYPSSQAIMCACPCHQFWWSISPPKCWCNCNIRIQELNDFRRHKNMKIDDNRKSSCRMDELELRHDALSYELKYCMEALQKITKDIKNIYEIYDSIKNFKTPEDCKRPYECPVCQGFAKHKVFGQNREVPCNACEAKGIVWG